MRWASLLLVVACLGLSPPSGAHADLDGWWLDDPAGDQRLVPSAYQPPGVNPTSLPSFDRAPSVPVADLRKVTVGGEDAIGFHIDFHVEQLRLGTLTPRRWASCPDAGAGTGGYPARLTARFRMDDWEYLVGVNLHGEWEDHAPFDLGVTGATACMVQVEGGRARGPGQRVDVVLDDATDRVHLFVPKSGLAGDRRVANQVYSPLYDAKTWPAHVPVGARIRDLEAAAYARVSPAGEAWATSWFYVVEDSMGPSTRTFDFARPMANGLIHLRLEEGAPVLPIRPGTNQTLELRVTNSASTKRIVAFEYRLGGPEERRGAYALYGPSRATVPAGEWRVLQLALDVGLEAREGDNVTVEVRATSVAFPDDVGFAEAVLVPGPHLGPDDNVLYFQSRETCSSDEPDRAVRDVVISMYPGTCRSVFLSSMRDDPRSTGNPPVRTLCYPSVADPGTVVCGLYVGTYGAGVATPMHFNASGRIRLELEFEPRFQADRATFEASILHYNDTGRSRTLAEWSDGLELRMPTTRLVLEAPVRLQDPVLPRGTHIYVQLRISFPASEEAARAAADLGMLVVTQKSRLTFPLLPPPSSPHSATLDHPLQLAILGVREDFINPGKSRLFNLTVFNQGGRAYEARLATETQRPGWSAVLLPGARFVLEPGDTIRLGVLVKAARDEADGSEAVVRVTLDDGAGRTSRATLTLVVVHTIDVGDDADRYALDAEAQAKLVVARERETPGLGWLGTVGAAVILVRERGSRFPRRRRAGRATS